MQGTKIRTQIWMFWEWFRTFFCAGKLANLSNSAVPFILKYCDSEYIWINLDLLFFLEGVCFLCLLNFSILVLILVSIVTFIFADVITESLIPVFCHVFPRLFLTIFHSLYPIHINGYISCASCYMLIFMSVLVSSCSFFLFWFCNNFLFTPHLSYPIYLHLLCIDSPAPVLIALYPMFLCCSLCVTYCEL